MISRLAVEIASLQLTNPTMLAAGILGMSGLTLNQVVEAGAGAVVTKSLGLKPRRGYPNPTVVQVEGGLLNAMGLPNPGVEHFAREIKSLDPLGAPMIVSIYASTPKEFGLLAKKALNTGAKGLELNVSCPHAKGVGAEVGQDSKLVKEIVREVKRSVEAPILVKLTPNVADITELAKAAEKGGADAITAINTVRAMAINIETAKPILGNKVGGLSGPAVKPIAIRCVYEIYETVEIPIVGCGGVTTWQDAVEFMQAGASAVQVGTAIATRGLAVFKEIIYGVEAFMKRKKIGNVKEIVGLSHRS